MRDCLKARFALKREGTVDESQLKARFASKGEGNSRRERALKCMGSQLWLLEPKIR